MSKVPQPTPQRIWITGASSGIGRMSTIALVRAGHRVLASARRTEALNALADDCHELAGQVEVMSCDVTLPESCTACATWMSEQWGGIDVVIPNAGIGYFDPLTEGKLLEWKSMVDVNVTGVLNTLHAALPMLLKAKGLVINIGSLAARQVFPNSGVYCATKHAVLAISESLRTEFRNEIAVTTLNPGAVNTPFIDRTTNESLRASYRPQFDEGMDPEFVAQAIVWTIACKGKGVVSELTIRPDRR